MLWVVPLLWSQGNDPGSKTLHAQQAQAIVQDSSRLTVILGDINEWFSLARTLRQLGAHFGHSSTARQASDHLPLVGIIEAP